MQSSTALRYRLISTDLCASILVLVRLTPGKWSARIKEGLNKMFAVLTGYYETKDTEGAGHRIL